jgi:[ribosomal protein S5]-alanine N-acetyltransferase
MLVGPRVRLRPIRADELEQVYEHNLDLDARGAWFPLEFSSLPQMRREYHEHGFWERDHGMLVIVDEADALLGAIFFFRRVTYHWWNSYEVAYRLYSPEVHGRGYATEALGLLVEYLFASRPVNRLELAVAPENRASIRVAEKCGFVVEGVARGAFYLRGAHLDMVVMARLRDDLTPAEG